jgi:hypothetical protein
MSRKPTGKCGMFQLTQMGCKYKHEMPMEADEENEELELSPAFQASFGNRQRAGNHSSCTGPQAAAGPTHATKTQIPFHCSSHYKATQLSLGLNHGIPNWYRRAYGVTMTSAI